MNYAQILGYPLLLISAFEFFLGLLLLRQNPRNSPVNKATAACAIAAALWSLSASLMYIRLSAGMDYLIYARLSWIGWFTVPTALQTVLFLRDESSRAARVVGWILYPFWTVVLLLCLFTDLIVTDGYIPLPYRNSPGPLEMPFRAAGSAMAFWLIYEIARLRSKVLGHRRTQLGYYLYGTIIFTTGGAVIGGVLQLFTGRGLEPSLSAFFSLPWVVLIFYAITRYRLFDIRIVLSRILYIVILSFGVSLFQFVLFRVIEPAAGAVASIFISIPIIGLLFFGTPLSKRVRLWIDELVLGSRQGYQRMLRGSIQAMITILNRDELLRHIVESVRTGMKVENACLYLADDRDRYVMRHGFGVFRDMAGTLLLDGEVAKVLVRDQQPIVRNLLDSGLSSAAAADVDRYLGKIRAELILPLFYKGALLGALTLGEKGDGEPYVQTDLDLLCALAGHAAIAIENARLFEEAGRFKNSLRESEAMFRSLAETTAAAIFIHRGEKLLYANSAGVRVLGYTVEEFLNMNFWQVIHPDYQELVRSRGKARLDGAQPPPHYEFKVITKSGEERWVYMTAGQIVFQGQPSIIGTLVDITDLKRAESDKERLYEESAAQFKARIEEQQRHQAEKEKILKDLHDGIGGLTTNIKLLAELSQNKSSLPDIKRSLATISELARESLFEIRSFIQTLDARELSWKTMAAEMRQLGNTIVEPHGIAFTIATTLDGADGEPGSVMGMNLFRIYKESLSNIVKHSQATAVDVVFAVDRHKVVLDVRDNGTGFGEKRGAGRGLTNMATRAREMGGDLAIVPTSGSGTRVHLEVPHAGPNMSEPRSR